MTDNTVIEMFRRTMGDKTPEEQRKILRSVSRYAQEEEEERLQAEDDRRAHDTTLPFDEVREELRRANKENDFEAIKYWGAIHGDKLKELTDKAQQTADEARQLELQPVREELDKVTAELRELHASPRVDLKRNRELTQRQDELLRQVQE